jgi:hypothetical protein
LSRPFTVEKSDFLPFILIKDWAHALGWLRSRKTAQSNKKLRVLGGFRVFVQAGHSGGKEFSIYFPGRFS